MTVIGCCSPGGAGLVEKEKWGSNPLGTSAQFRHCRTGLRGYKLSKAAVCWTVTAYRNLQTGLEMTEQLEFYIRPKGRCPLIGEEVGKDVRDGISLFFQSVRTFNPAASHPKGGSYRFVQFIDGQIVAALQVISQTGESGTVANVYCDPNFRRRGHTTALLERAREQFEPLELSTDQTPDGRAWTDSLGAEPTGPKRI